MSSQGPGSEPAGEELIEKPGVWKRRIQLALALVVVLGALGLVGSTAGRPLRQASLLPEAQRFTQLSFPEAGRLPVTYAPGQPLNFDFELVNHEGRTVTYIWAADVMASGNNAVVAAGAVTLAPESSQVITVSTVFGAGGDAVVRVRLAGRSEAIQFPLQQTP